MFFDGIIFWQFCAAIDLWISCICAVGIWSSRCYYSALLVYCSGYQASYKKSGGRTDGCATFYKQSKFNCCNSVPVELCADDCSVLNRPNVALLLLLEPLVSGQTNCSSTCICVANTHLLYNPCRGDVKLAQLMFLFAAIDELAGMSAEPRPKYHPMILCGDFNLEPFSYLYEFVVNGSLRFEGLPMKALSGQTRDESGRRMNPRCFLSPQVDVTDSCQFFDVTEHRQRLSRCSHRWRSFDESFCSGTACHSLNLASAYDNMSPDALTSWLGHRSRGAQVDYIFYSVESPLPHSGRGRFRKCRSMSEALLTLTCVLQLPTLEEVCRSGGLPNNRESSDHLMLMAWFVLSNCVWLLEAVALYMSGLPASIVVLCVKFTTDDWMKIKCVLLCYCKIQLLPVQGLQAILNNAIMLYWMRQYILCHCL